MSITLFNNSVGELLTPFKDTRLSVSADARRHQTWQRAMEQAQLVEWFKPAQEADQNAQVIQTPGKSVPTVPSVGVAARVLIGERSPEVPLPRDVTAMSVLQALRLSDEADFRGEVVAKPGILDVDPIQPSVATTQVPSNSPTVVDDVSEPPAALVKGHSIAPDVAAEVQRYLNVVVTTEQLQAPLTVEVEPAARGASLKASGALELQPGLEGQRLEVSFSPMLLPQDSARLPAPARSLEDRDAPPVNDDEPLASPSTQKLNQLIPSQDPASPVRVHLDWSAQGVRIWLGVDQEQIPFVPGLARHLDAWLTASGVKLVNLVCNGRTIYPRFYQRRHS
jgi:hypothetical protein